MIYKTEYFALYLQPLWKKRKTQLCVFEKESLEKNLHPSSGTWTYTFPKKWGGQEKHRMDSELREGWQRH